MFCEELVADEAYVPPERDLIAAYSEDFVGWAKRSVPTIFLT